MEASALPSRSCSVGCRIGTTGWRSANNAIPKPWAKTQAQVQSASAPTSGSASEYEGNLAFMEGSAARSVGAQPRGLLVDREISLSNPTGPARSAHHARKQKTRPRIAPRPSSEVLPLALFIIAGHGASIIGEKVCVSDGDRTRLPVCEGICKSSSRLPPRRVGCAPVPVLLEF